MTQGWDVAWRSASLLNRVSNIWDTYYPRNVLPRVQKLTQSETYRYFDSQIILGLCSILRQALAKPCDLGRAPISPTKKGVTWNVSKTLSKSHRNYSQIQKEALAIVFGFKKLYQYLHGRHLILVTDHKPLIIIFGWACISFAEHQNKPLKPAVHLWMLAEKPWTRLQIMQSTLWKQLAGVEGCLHELPLHSSKAISLFKGDNWIARVGLCIFWVPPCTGYWQCFCIHVRGVSNLVQGARHYSLNRGNISPGDKWCCKTFNPNL